MSGEDVSVEAIKQFGEVDFYNSTPDELVAERIADANIVVANKSPMNESTMKDAKQVKMICQLSTGYDNVDIEYCKNRGIHVANARNYSTAAVAQHTVALALSVLENLPYYDNYVKSGAYASQPRFAHFKPWYELEGKTWGIAGMGNIGRRVAKAAEALGCKVIFYATSGHSDCRTMSGGLGYPAGTVRYIVSALSAERQNVSPDECRRFFQNEKERSVDQCGARCGCGYGCAV